MDWTTVAVAVVGMIQVVLLAICVPLVQNLLTKVEQVRHETNSMKDALVTATKTLGETQGHAQGVKDEKLRVAEATASAAPHSPPLIEERKDGSP